MTRTGLNLSFFDLLLTWKFLRNSRMAKLIDLAMKVFQLGHGRVHRRNMNTPKMLREKMVRPRVLHSNRAIGRVRSKHNTRGQEWGTSGPRHRQT